MFSAMTDYVLQQYSWQSQYSRQNQEEAKHRHTQILTIYPLPWVRHCYLSKVCRSFVTTRKTQFRGISAFMYLLQVLSIRTASLACFPWQGKTVHVQIFLMFKYFKHVWKDRKQWRTPIQDFGLQTVHGMGQLHEFLRCFSYAQAFWIASNVY